MAWNTFLAKYGRRPGMNRRYSFIRDGVKILLITVACASCAFSIFSMSMRVMEPSPGSKSSGGHSWPNDPAGHSGPSGPSGHSWPNDPTGLFSFKDIDSVPTSPPVITNRQSLSSAAILPIQISRPETMLRLNAVYPHNFNYTILETDICLESPFLLTVVHTHPSHYKRRMAIRETWANGGHLKSQFDPTLKMIVLFMMGSSSTLMESVKAESERYRDIVQENFEDTYRNLTHKAIMWLKWTSTYCPNVKYVLKVDDDVLVNTFNLIKHIHYLYVRSIASKKSILCLVWYRMQVIRNPNSKWYVSREEYPHDYFTMYCSGSAYILTGDLIQPLYTKALQTRFFWIDDYYVTGLLPKSMDVHYHNIASLYALKQVDVPERLLHKNAVFGHVPGSLSMMYMLWREILHGRGLATQAGNETGPRN